MNRKDTNNMPLATLWFNWVLAVGLIILSIVASTFVKPVYLPVAMFVGIVFLTARMRTQHADTQSLVLCPHMLWVGIQVLLWSGLIMLVINILHSHLFGGRVLTGEGYNRDIPFVPSLIIFPVSIVFTGFTLFYQGRFKSCKECRAKQGLSSRDGFVGNVIHREFRYQVRLALILAVITSIIEYIYYFIFYINININLPDKFYFVVLPAAIYVLSSVFLGGRYARLSHVFAKDTNTRAQQHVTLVRFMVFEGDHLLLEPIQVGSDASLSQWDIPTIVKMPFRDDIDDTEALRLFKRLAGTDDNYEIRRLYSTQHQGNQANVFHYAVFLTPQQREEFSVRGDWMTIYTINALYTTHQLSSPLTAEIHRIFTITMAWKTYDKDGRRLYPIKNYRPTFRLRDLKDWDVDYNDMRWFGVASNNQDRPFYALRRLWRKYITGIGQ